MAQKRELPPPARTMVTVAEAASRLNCSTMTVRRRIRSGAIKAYRPGPRVLMLDLAEIDHYISHGPQVPPVRR